MGTKPDESWDKNPTPNPVTTLQNPVPPSRTQRVERTPVVGRGRKTSKTVKAGPNPVPTRSQPDPNPIRTRSPTSGTVFAAVGLDDGVRSPAKVADQVGADGVLGVPALHNP